jgi:hypothetical protein
MTGSVSWMTDTVASLLPRASASASVCVPHFLYSSCASTGGSCSPSKPYTHFACSSCHGYVTCALIGCC